MCFQKGINWNDCPTSQKRGRCIVKKEFPVEGGVEHNTKTPIIIYRNKWTVDNEIPIFSTYRKYIDQYTYPLMVVNIPSVRVVPDVIPEPKIEKGSSFDDYIDHLKDQADLAYWKDLDSFDNEEDF